MNGFPDAFESLAGMCKFKYAEKLDEKFYLKYFHAIESANAFLGVMAQKYPPVNKAFQKSIPLPTKEGGRLIKKAFMQVNISEDDLNWFDRQMTIILQQLLPVVRSSDLPEIYKIVKFSIEGAFY